jgi:short-subunit dehydrogenase
MKGKVVLITGASGGIGLALAQRFGAEGANLSICGRSASALEEARKSLSSQGYKVLAVQADVANKEDCARFIDSSLKEYGRIDVLVNNAGISMRALFRDMSLDVMEQIMQINFMGTVYCTRYALEALIQSKGSIVGISSIAGYRGLPARCGYSASKFAMNGFLESIRTELLYEGVNVLTASPGFTASGILNKALSADGSPQGESPLDEAKIMSAEAVADCIFKAVVARKRSLILTRQGKLTVWMNKWFPALMDKMVFNHFAAEPDSPLKKR